MRNKRIYQILQKIIITVILTYTMYAQMICNTDDAGTYTYMYNLFELGTRKIKLIEWLNPWFSFSGIIYLLRIGKTGIEKSLIYLAVWYGICAFLTLILATRGRKRSWLVFLATFILLPSEMTNKYHLFVSISTLFLLLLIDSLLEEKSKWKIFLIVLWSLYTVIFTDDRMLFVLYIGGTMALYFSVYLLQTESKRNRLYLGLFAISITFMILNLINIFFNKKYGINAFGEWNGYGGSDYLNWIDFQTFVNKGIPSIYNSLLRQWNAVPQGGMIQISSFYWIVRIIIICLAIFAFVYRWYEIIKKGLDNVAFVDVGATLCVTIVLLINSLNGMIKYYDIDSAPINRYASVCWFLLVVIVVRWIDEKYKCIAIRNGMNSDQLVLLICICSIIGNIYPFYFGRTNNVEDDYMMEVNYLSEHKNEYAFGLADMWISDCITAKTNGDIFVLPARIEENTLVNQGREAVYYDGGNYFNYIISDLSYPLTMTEENVNNVRGDYVGIYANADTIYRYDYDIRFEPKLIMATGTENAYDMVDELNYYIEMPIGTNRIEITSANRDNIKMAVQESEDINVVKYDIKGDNICYADVTCLQNTQISLSLTRKEDTETPISKIDMRRVYASVNIPLVQNYINLNEGKYIITFEGSSLKELDLKWDDNTQVEQITDGNKKRKYLVSVSTTNDVCFEYIAGKENVTRIYYENEDLFNLNEE